MCAAAVCPQAPALVPEVGHGIAVELADVRAAALAAIDVVVAASPDRIVVLGDGGEGWDESAGGTFRGFGPDVRVGGPELLLPPGLAVGAWLLDEVGWPGPRTYASKLDVDAAERVGVLVMADGSARHRVLAPEWADVEGRTFDAAVATALADGDALALASLDLDAADVFKASGIAGLATLGEACDNARIDAQLRYDGAPFDVGYWVADWRLA
jgi:hypothetical protein